MQIHSRCVTSDHGCVEKHSSSRLEAFFQRQFAFADEEECGDWIRFRWMSSIGLLQVEAGVGSAAHFHLPGRFYQTESSSETPTLFMATKILWLSSMLRLLKYSRWGVYVNSACTSSHTTHSILSTWLLLNWTAWLSRDAVYRCHCLNQTCIGFILEHCCAFK